MKPPGKLLAPPIEPHPKHGKATLDRSTASQHQRTLQALAADTRHAKRLHQYTLDENNDGIY